MRSAARLVAALRRPCMLLACGLLAYGGAEALSFYAQAQADRQQGLAWLLTFCFVALGLCASCALCGPRWRCARCLPP